jgi:hypothetical protein
VTGNEKNDVIATIRANIGSCGQHIHLVSGGSPLPRFAYTIGLYETVGLEVILAGATAFNLVDARTILNTVADRLRADGKDTLTSVDVARLGTFSLLPVDASWSKLLLLGALDFYDLEEITVLQISPAPERFTLDVPDLSRPWDEALEPVWRWLHTEWEFPVPAQSVATTNLAALRGDPVTEVARWEETEWEMFAGAGPDVPPADVRVVPLGTLIGIDQSVDAATKLGVGSAIWRDPDATSTWNVWGGPS